jgi:spermidine synthase
MAGMFSFPPDMQRVAAPVNRLDNQVLVRLYEEDWKDMSL